MGKYIVYDTNGTILKYGVCQNKDLKFQCEAGQFIKVIPALEPGFDVTYKVKRGATSDEDTVVAVSVLESEV